MEVLRTIGRHELLVETCEPCGISLEEELAAQIGAVEASIIGKQKLLRTLAAGDDYYPLTTHWELWDRCNLACPFCYIVGHSANRVVRFDEIHHQLSDLIDAGLLFCTLTGGESILHPDFIAIYRFLKERGVIVEVFSNGINFGDDILALFAELPPVAVEISIYSLDNGRMRDVFGSRTSDAASAVQTNVRRLRAAGVKVVCKSFVNTLTIDEVSRVERWCLDNAVEYYSSAEISQAYDGADLRGFSAAPGQPKPSNVRAAICLPCGTKNYGSAITSAFGLYPCPSIRLPDCVFSMRELGVAESIRRMKAFMRRFQDEAIHGACGGASGCANCMAYAKPVRDVDGQIVHFAQP